MAVYSIISYLFSIFICELSIKLKLYLLEKPVLEKNETEADQYITDNDDFFIHGEFMLIGHLYAKVNAEHQHKKHYETNDDVFPIFVMLEHILCLFAFLHKSHLSGQVGDI